jgi:exosortase
MEPNQEISIKDFKLYLYLMPVVLLFSLVFYSTLVWLHGRYVAADSYYSHGFLVPIVSAVLIWLKRRELKDIPLSYSKRGLLLIILALSMHLVSSREGVFFISGFSIVVFIFGASLFLFGSGITKRVSFPMLFLIFMIPLPLVAVNAISLPIRKIVIKSAMVILDNFLNLPVKREGFQIFLPHASLVVENLCGGLRSLIVMLALGSIFTYFLKASLPKKITFFVLTIPMVLFCNIARVTLLSLGVYIFGMRMAEKYLHDSSGYVMFVIAFAGLWLLWRAFQCKDSV